MEQYAVIAVARARARGFTMVELLVVLAILAILATLSIPAISSVMENSNLTQGGQVLADQVNTARQLASVRNRSVEVRLIRLTNLSSQGFQAIQLWMADSSGNMAPAGKIAYLPTPTAISSNTTLSGLVSTRTSAMSFSGTMPASGMTASAPYASFRVRSSGEIEPVPAAADRQYLFVTVLPARLVSTAALPRNYIIEQIDPDTGNVQVFRP